MIAIAAATEIEKREASRLSLVAKKQRKQIRAWPSGFKIINGKRVYPNGQSPFEETPIKSNIPPNMKEVRLDSGLPPDHRMSTPAVENKRLIGEVPLFEMPETKQPNDFDVLAASIGLLMARVDSLTSKVNNKESATPNVSALITMIRARCVDHAFGRDSELNRFARSLVDQIDSFTIPS
jgi:hypothetical protein